MSHGSPRSEMPSQGKHAWDDRDTGSIATHTPSYRSVIAAERVAADTVAEQARAWGGFSATVRLASAMMARMRGRGPAVATEAST